MYAFRDLKLSRKGLRAVEGAKGSSNRLVDCVIQTTLILLSEVRKP